MTDEHSYQSLSSYGGWLCHSWEISNRYLTWLNHLAFLCAKDRGELSFNPYSDSKINQDSATGKQEYTCEHWKSCCFSLNNVLQSKTSGETPTHTPHHAPYLCCTLFHWFIKKFMSGFQWYCSSMGSHCFRRAVLADQQARHEAGLPLLPPARVPPIMFMCRLSAQEVKWQPPSWISGRQETAHCPVQGHTAPLQDCAGDDRQPCPLPLHSWNTSSGPGGQGGVSILLSSRQCLFLAATNWHGL